MLSLRKRRQRRSQQTAFAFAKAKRIASHIGSSFLDFCIVEEIYPGYSNIRTAADHQNGDLAIALDSLSGIKDKKLIEIVLSSPSENSSVPTDERSRTYNLMVNSPDVTFSPATPGGYKGDLDVN